MASRRFVVVGYEENGKGQIKFLGTNKSLVFNTIETHYGEGLSIIHNGALKEFKYPLFCKKINDMGFVVIFDGEQDEEENFVGDYLLKVMEVPENEFIGG